MRSRIHCRDGVERDRHISRPRIGLAVAMLSLPSIRVDRVQLELAAQDGIGLHRRELQGLMIYEVISKQQSKPLHFVVQRHTADP